MTQTSITVRRRAAILLLSCTAVFILLSLRLAHLQLIIGGRLQQSALEQRYHSLAVDPQRGAILDRNGRKLAVSVHSDAVVCNPREVENVHETALRLAPILNMDAARLEQLMTRKVMYVWLKRRITGEQAKQIRELNLPGIQITLRTQRAYPKGVLAAQILGITGVDNQGLEGIEIKYDEYLRGTPGSDNAEFDTGGRRIPGGEKQYIPPKDGDSVVLTLDEHIQYIAERELDKAMAETQSKRGLIMAMDPKTGEILACAMRPTFSPDDYSAAPSENRRSFAFTDQYEPGSTFKVVTTAASLEEGIVTKDSTFFDPGFLRVEDRVLKCWKAGGHGSQTFVEAIENSCNPVFAGLALKLGVERFYRYIRAFGFGRPSGIDFPGEASGTLMKDKSIGPVELANNGFGQGISVTPLQLLSAVSAIANGGKVMQPLLVREIRAVDGTVVHRYDPKMMRQVISPASASVLSELMESVVVNGSGNRASVPGYRVAGKTGTAEKPKGGRYSDDRVASFIGFAPADDPRLAILVMFDEPQTAIRYGGVLAAPAFAAVMGDSLRYLGVPPRVTVSEQSPSQTEVTVPNILNLPLGDAQSILAQNGLSWRLIDGGSVVIDQFPRPGARVKWGTRILIYFDPGDDLSAQPYATVPDLKGLTVREAAERLKELDLLLSPSGSGVAHSQHPPPGTRLPRGARVMVEFQPPQTP